MKRKVAIQGVEGSFHEEAVRSFYADFQIIHCHTFEQIYKEMESGRADAAVMAIENTTSGGLIPNYELLRKYGRKIKGEVYLSISQNLMALPGQRIEDIKEVMTHFMAINQTLDFFSQYPHIELKESENTATSAAEIAEKGLKGVAAVASRCAAERYGLEILAEGIETYKQNFTRFLLMDDGIEIPQEERNKASLCFTLPHKTGSLAHILAFLSFYEMNLTRIQSLPIPGKSWQYFFYIDITFESYQRYTQAISAVRPLIEDLQILGEYRSGADIHVF